MSIDASIILPVYNSAPTLAGCLTAVLDQDVDNFEVIAVDDGSTDDSGRILEQWAQLDPRLTVIRCDQNGGAAQARNHGIQRARAATLLFVDSDSFVGRDWVRRHLAAQSRSSIVGGAIVGVHSTIYGRADAYCSWFDSIPEKTKVPRPRRHLPTANLSVARRVFEHVGLFRGVDHHYSEDAEFCQRARRAGESLHFDPAIVVRHCDRDGWQSFLRHQWVAGVQMFNYRREPGAEFGWAMPRNRLQGGLLALPFAAAYTALIVKRWGRYDSVVFLSLPLIFTGKLVQALAVSAASGKPYSVVPAAPVLASEPRRSEISDELAREVDG